MEGNAPTVRGPAAPTPREQEGSSGLRLCRRPGCYVGSHVQEKTVRLCGAWLHGG